MVSVSVVTSVLVVRTYLTPECKTFPPLGVKAVNSYIMKLLLIPTLDEKVLGDGQKHQKSRKKSSNQISPQFKAAEASRVQRGNVAEDNIQSSDVDTMSEDDKKLRNTLGWKLLSELIDRFVLILYITALTGGSIYYIVALLT